MEKFYGIKILITIFLLTSSSIIFSQTNIGFRYEPFYQNTSLISKGSNIFSTRYNGIYPIGLYFSITHEFSKNFGMSFRPGILGTGDRSQYNGFELSIVGKYNFDEKDIYLLFGLNLHENLATVSYSNINHPREGLFPLLFIGSGIKLSKVFSIEPQFYIPLKRHFGEVYHFTKDPINMNYMIKLSFGFEWEI